MIYVVTGYWRTGTSMMMKCLEAGGLDALYRKRTDSVARANGGSVHEMGLCPRCRLAIPAAKVGAAYEWECEGFPCAMHMRRATAEYDGRLIKALCTERMKHLDRVLPPWEYQTIIMLRDPAEIGPSYRKLFPEAPTPPMIKAPILYHRHFDRVWKAAKGRKLKVQMRRVVDEPLSWFRHMKACGWPIDPVAAASVVDPSMMHHRAEAA